MSEITVRGIRMVLRDGFDARYREGWVDAYLGEQKAFGRLQYNTVYFGFQPADKFGWLHELADRRYWILDESDETKPDRPHDGCSFALTDEQTAALVGDQPEPQPESESAPIAVEREAVQEFGIGGINRDADSYAETAALIEDLRRTEAVDTSSWVLCDCGHCCPPCQVMSASLGTSCPDCYDRMS